MNIILIIGFWQALILAGLIFNKKEKTTSDTWLAGLFLIKGITILLAYLEIYNRQNEYPFPFIINSSTPFILLHGPFLWFYIKSLTTQHYSFKTKYLLHFIPFVLVLFIFSMGIYGMSAAEKIAMDINEEYKNDFVFPLVVGTIAISTQTYFIWGLLLIGSYRRKIKKYFSEVSQIDLKWLSFLLSSGIIFYAINSGMYILDYLYDIMSYHIMQPAAYGFASIFVLIIGYYGYKQGNIFSRHQVKADLEKSNFEDSSEDKTPESAEKTFIGKLMKHMKEEQPHLNSELTLAHLADALGCNAEYLSEILNEHLHRNFFDFINHYRVEEFKRRCRLPENQNFTIMSMAYDSGFNSKATFNRVFKKYTGQTPGAYAKSCS